MRKITAIILSLILMMSCYNVFAVVTVDDTLSTVTLSGTIASGAEGVLIGIDVFCPGKGYQNLREATYGEYNKVIVLRKQITSGENGVWETKFSIYDDPMVEGDAPSGIYKAIIFPADSTQPIYETFSYLNLQTAKSLIDEINLNGTQSTIEDMLRTKKEELGLSYDFVTNLDVPKTATLILEAKESGRLSNSALIDNVNAIRSAAVIEGVSEGVIGDLFVYAEALGLGQGSFASYYQKGYVKNHYAAITKALSGTSYQSYQSFINALYEQTVLQVVKNSDGVGNIKEIVNLFANRSDWTGNYSDQAYLSVQGNTYTSYALLKAALDVAENGKNIDSGNGSSGSFGGGGGASSGVSGPSFSADSVTDGNIVMEYQIFDDIADISWAKDAIVHLAQLGIVNGKTETKFYPHDTITREELAKILVLTFAKDITGDSVTFQDADPAMWYYPYIARAVAAGIVNGYSKEQFGVGMPVTRQEMCTMIYRAAKNNGITLENGQMGFEDEGEIADYAKEAVSALAASGIVVGNDLNNFAPSDVATRAQVAKVVYRLMMQ